MKLVISILAFIVCINASCQQKDITTALYDSYSSYKESSLNKRRIKHTEIQPLIAKYKDKEGYTVKKVGESIEGRSISLISVGKGDTIF